MNTALTTIVELHPVDYLERRMQRIVELVNLAEDMGFDINGFHDENELMHKISETEIGLLSDLIYKKDKNFPAEQVFNSELKLEKFNAIACRIIDAIQT